MQDLNQRLRILKSEIENTQRNAAAEHAFEATGGTDNPWKGAGEKLTSLHIEYRQVELEIAGNALVARLERLRTLDKELAAAMETRTSADEAQRAASEHEAVGRWKKAGR